jgi:hypothetical protein
MSPDDLECQLVWLVAAFACLPVGFAIGYIVAVVQNKIKRWINGRS